MSKNSPPFKKDCVLTQELVESPQSQRIASSTLFADLRKSPRFDTCSPAELTTEDGAKYPCFITNISRAGLQFEGDWGVRSTLPTGFMRFRKHKASIVDISFSLPSRVSHYNPVSVLCETVYTRKAKQDVFLTGVKFVSFKNGEDILIEYLSFRELIG